jgi:hypothetical protein
MAFDWDEWKNEWISSVRRELAPHLLTEHRFPDAQKLINCFEVAISQYKRDHQFRAVINTANELAAAAAILKFIRPSDVLRYEPKLRATRKTIDFLVECEDGTRGWIDMKAVAPTWRNDEAAWNKLLTITQGFPENARLIVDRAYSGAGISNGALNARWSFVQRTAEVEKKIALLTGREQGPVWLLLCSDGSWRHDALEDFADFYRHGCFREDDWSRNAIRRYMVDRRITFQRTISGFVYLERRHEEVWARRFEFDVKGPRLFGPMPLKPAAA